MSTLLGKRYVSKYVRLYQNDDLDSRFVAVFSFALICSSHSTADEVRGSVDSLILFVFVYMFFKWMAPNRYLLHWPRWSVSFRVSEKTVKVGKKKTELDCS